MAETGRREIGFFQRVDGFVRTLANGMTFGLADYIAGAGNTAVQAVRGQELTPLRNMDSEVERTQQAQIDQGKTVTVVAIMAGGALSGMAIARTAGVVNFRDATTSAWNARVNQAGLISDKAYTAAKASGGSVSSANQASNLAYDHALARASQIQSDALLAVGVSSGAGSVASLVGNRARPDNLVPGNTPCLDYGDFRTRGCDRNK